MDPGFSGLQNSQGNSVVFPGEKVNRKDPFALPLNTGMRQTGTRTGEAGSGLGGGVQSPIICSSSSQDLAKFSEVQLGRKSLGSLCLTDRCSKSDSDSGKLPNFPEPQGDS